MLANVAQLGKMLLAGAWFGLSTGKLDAYFVSLNVPVTFQTISMAALNAGFVPIYVAHATARRDGKARELADGIVGFGLVFYGILCALLAIFAAPVIRLTASGFSAAEISQNAHYFRILLLTLLAGGLAGVITGVYIANHRYGLPSFAPVLGAVASLVYLIVFRSQGVDALVYGTVFGSLLHVLILFVGARSFGNFRPGLSVRFAGVEFREIYRTAFPVAAGLILVNATLLIDQSVASWLLPGSVSVVNFANRLNDTFARISVLSVASALLPFLSTYVAQQDYQSLRSAITSGRRAATIMLLPIPILLGFFSFPVIAAVFQRISFTSGDAHQAALAWTAYSVALLLMAASVFSSRALQAMRRYNALWIGTAVAIPLNVIMAVALGRMAGTTGVALSRTFVYLVCVVIYDAALLRNADYARAKVEGRWPIIAIVVALASSTAIAFVFHLALGHLLVAKSILTTLFRLKILSACGCAAGASLATYFGILHAMKVSETAQLFTFLKRVLHKIPGMRRSSSATTVEKEEVLTSSR